MSGTSAIANGNIGIEVNEAPNNTVGGTIPEARNVFSGNGGAGVFLTGAAATGNVVRGNYIGTNAAGTSAVANQKMGLSVGASPGAIGANSNIIGGSSGTTPGGACTGSCNLISGNVQNGIFISGTESYGHQIIGNYIGLNAAGTSNIGNHLDGIGVLSTPNNQIGGNSANHRNIVSGNGSNGIIIVGGASTGNRVEGNYLGLSSTGGLLGNAGSGIAISSATDVAILANSTASNGLLGIDLDNNGSANQNDPQDGDTGANRLQNTPVIYAAQTKGGTTRIGGQFNGTPNSSFRIDFFYSDGCNAGYPNNYGEGQTFISSSDINTDVFGNTAFGISTPSAIGGNKYITSTATKKIGGVPAETSEFSQCVLVNTSKPALTNGATWFLKYDLTTGPADKTFGYGFPSTLLMCAWDPNQPGVKLPTIYYNGSWFMRASYTTGTADLNFSYGNGSHQAICGDWDGDGVDTPGVVTADNQWLLRNSNSSGGADAGSPSYGFVPGFPIVGDWDGNGTDSIGSVSPGGTWAMRTSNDSGAPQGTFQYGFPGTVPLVW